MAGDVEFKISNDVIQSIVEKKIHAEVASAMASSSDDIINTLVENALGKGVGHDGQPVRHRGDIKFSNYIEYALHNKIKSIAGEVVEGWIEGSQSKMKKQIEQSLTKKAKSISSALVDNFINGNASSIKYDLKVYTPNEATIDSQLTNLRNRVAKIERG